MKEEIISLDIAILAKKKGFDVKSDWLKLSLLDINDNTIDKFSAAKLCLPTQSLLQKWLREVHNLHLDIWYNFLTSKWRNEAIINLLTDKNYVFLDDKEYDTYEQALEEGLKESLKLIK